MNTDTVLSFPTPLDMGPSLRPRENSSRMFEHANKEFAMGVGFLAETGNSADVAVLMERFIEAMNAQAQAHAAITQKARLPGWVAPTIASLILFMLTGACSGLVWYGSVTSRLQAVESKTQAVDRLTSIEARVDLLIGQVTRMEGRFNVLMDNQGRAKQ